MSMRLFSVSFSPFAMRVRAAIRHKRAPIQISDPPGGLRSDEYRKLVPTGKVPALLLDSGTVLSESLALLEYIDDRFPDPPLKPAKAENRARMRQIMQMTDAYFGPSFMGLFGALRSSGGLEQAASMFERAHDVLAQIERVAAPRELLLGREASLADYTLASNYWFYLQLPRVLDLPDPAPPARIQSWWEEARELPALSAEWPAVKAGFAEYLRQYGRDPNKLID